MTQTRLPDDDGVGGEPQPSLLGFAALVLRHLRLIVTTTVVVAVLSVVLALAIPRTWTSRVVLVPSSGGGGDSRMQMLASQLGMAGLAAGRGGGNSSQSLAAIVKSKALLDSVSQHARATRQVNLSKKALDRLLKNGTSVGTDPVSRAMAIEVTAKDPVMAQRLASAFPAAVNAIATEIALEAAAHKRATLEQQLELARANLSRSQQALLAFQERTGTPQIQEQARQSVAAAAELQRAVTQQEVRVSQLRRVATPDNPELRSAMAQLETLRGQLRRLASDGSEVFLSGRALPGVQLELAQRMRNYQKDEQVYSMLTADLMDAQLDLRDNLAVVSVLDAPAVPEIPSGPHRTLIVIVGTMLGGLLGLFGAYLAESLQNARAAHPDEPLFVELKRLARARQGNGRHAGVA